MKKKWIRDALLFGIQTKMWKIMRLNAFFLLLCFSHSWAFSGYSQATKLTLKMSDSKIIEVLDEIEEQSEFFFLFNQKLVDVERKVDIDVQEKTIDFILQNLFAGTNVNHMVIDRQIVLTTFNEELLPQQQPAISGTVTDENGLPLPGVTVVIKGTTQGTVTNANGNYSLANIPENATLLFSFVGMRTQELQVGNQTTINVEMFVDAIGIEEVIAVGYGTQRKSDITGAVASVKTEQLANMPQTTITQALQGKIAGINISSDASNAEGNENTIQIRGRNSISAGNSPLIILDGVPYSGRLSEISPNDIQSIEVLKDASSSAIYGARAANGVILVTTKRGKEGKPEISYDGYFGLDEIAHLPDMMNADQFYETKIDRYGEGVLTLSEIESHSNGIDTDWIDLATQIGQRQRHNLSLSGGTPNTHYFLSGTYDQIKGIAKNDDFNRLTVRINLDTKVNSWLTIGTNSQLGVYNRDGQNASFSQAFQMNPLTIPFEEDGKTIELYPWSEDPYFDNPLDALNSINEDLTHSIINNSFLQVDFPFLKGLSYKVNTGYNYRYRLNENYSGKNTVNGLEKGGVSTVNNWTNKDWLVENLLIYNHGFGKHNIGFTGLYSAQKSIVKNHELNASGFPSDIMTYYQNKLAATWNPSDVYTEQTILSQMARLNYSYDGRYLLTMTARRDGFSAFGDDSKFGIFPSIALGWNMHKEDFFSDIEWISNLKLRLSFGENGNQAISAYSTLPSMSRSYYLDNSKETIIGFYPSKLGDPTLSWETTRAKNLGIDFSFLKGQVQGSFDYFNSKTSDLLLNKSISPVNGTGRIRQNIGETQNKGFEFQVSSTNIRKNDFSWSTDFYISKYKNEILNVGLTDVDGNPIDDIGNEWFIGKPILVNYHYVFDGIWQENDDIVNSPQPTAKPGDVKVKDVSGPEGIPDGKITADDKSIIGSRVPKYTAGLTNTLKYKNWSLSFFIYTVQGITRKNSTLMSTFDMRTNIVNLDFWSPENPINTYPANRDDSNPHRVVFFDKASSNASFIRLKDVTLSYKLPQRTLKNFNIDALEFYCNAKNLFTISDWVGLDPELNSQTAIPLTRTYLFGLRFNL